MVRPYAWIVSVVSLALVFVFAFRPLARTADRDPVLANVQVAPSVPIELEGCPSVAEREAYEESNCLQAIRLDLLEGEIDLEQALALLESCASSRDDLASLEQRAALLRADAVRARQAFGGAVARGERAAYVALETTLGRELAPPDPAAVERLRAAGVTHAGFARGRESRVLERLAADRELRDDFREVFGDIRADELEVLLAGESADLTAVEVGSTTIVPGLPPVVATPEGTLAVSDEGGGGLRAVPTRVYRSRLVADLAELERSRQRYLSSAARLHQRNGSVRVWLASLRTVGRENPATDLEATVARDRAELAANLANLRRTLGADPLVARMAGESVGLVTEIDRTCRSAADRRRRWMRNGAGVVAGLVGAAGVVVAVGATGTLIGGVTIAAALEAGVGAYLIARSERIEAAIPSSVREVPEAAEPAAERPFDRPESERGLDEGDEGAGSDSAEEWFDDSGRAMEAEGVEGDGIDEEGDDETEDAPRENAIPPILPIDLPDELRELPPLLDSVRLSALRELTLPEIQERLDEFLSASDPAAWRRRAEDEAVEIWSAERMIDEARAALRTWERRRMLPERFGEFFIRAELERVPEERRADILMRAMGRYLHDRELYAGSDDVADLRQRVAYRLVAHCRAGPVPGDLALTACTNETALSILLVAALRDAGIEVPYDSRLGIQVFSQRVETVLYSRDENRVYSLTKGSETEGVVAVIYQPAIFYYSYLVSHGVVPEIDFDEHLVVALPDRPLPPEMDVEECVPDEDGGSFLGRAVAWVGSLFGVRRISDDDACAANDARSAEREKPGGNRTIGLQIPMPRNPVQRGGGGQSGGGQGGGGQGGGSPLDENAPGDPLASGSGGAEGKAGAQGGGGKGESGTSSGTGQTAGAGGDGTGEAAEPGAGGAEPMNAEQGDADGDAEGADGAEGAGGGGGEEGSASTSAGTGEGGYGIGNVTLPSGPNLTRIGRETVRSAERHERAGDLNVMPWRLREDEGMASGSTSRVLFADNARALSRFGDDDRFITLAPAEVEAQRRMLEANDFPIFSAETTCDSGGLPPRRVFRRAAPGDPGYRYVFCDQDESMVVFRDRADAESYARLSAPDRPLFLARLASERMARFENSEDIARLRAFLDDPNVLGDFSREQVYATVRAAADLLVFQNALESALVQSMYELGPSAIRSYYYEMHREVLQAPFFLALAESAYRLNQRLASDPLQSLAWANAQDELVRQGFFDLYFTIGGMMDWPDRWATLERRYGDPDLPPPAHDPDAPSLDFLQILSDPVRVRVDWEEDRPGAPSIRDRQPQEGFARTAEEVAEPTMSEDPDRQDEDEHQRGGTDGRGRAGDGESIGPERGSKPLQMVLIRIAPDTGDPDRERLPEDNQVRPGGTEGKERRQTEESASRQEPVLWVSPETFIDAILSTWDSRDLKPETAGRVPALLRFNQRLREIFLADMHPVDGIYDNRLRAAMELFTRGGWLRYAEAREAMGGPLAGVRAIDTGRFSGAYSGNAPINDQDQIRIPNFFSNTGVVIPADLFEPIREHYSRAVLGIFDLRAEAEVAPAIPLHAAPTAPGESAAANREALLRDLEIITRQANETD